MSLKPLTTRLNSYGAGVSIEKVILILSDGREVVADTGSIQEVTLESTPFLRTLMLKFVVPVAQIVDRNYQKENKSDAGELMSANPQD